MTERQTGRDAVVAVITEAFNTAHDPAPAEHPEFEKHRRHDGHIMYGGCDLCQGDVAKLGPHIADALAAAGLLVSTPDTPGHHVQVTVDPARNSGHPSFTRGMVPLYAAIGLLLAGDTEGVVREEYGLTESELRLVAALTEDVRGLLAERQTEPAGDVVDAVAEALREVMIDLGPNTVEAIGRGQRRIHLSGGERRAIAMTAALVAFESRSWRELSKEAREARVQQRVAYRERAQLVAILASLFPAVWAYSDPAEPEWPVVYVDTPQGQCSWHLSPEDVDLFGHVEQVAADDPRARWDGHTTSEKYRRLAEVTDRG